MVFFRTYVLRSVGRRSTIDSDELERIQANFNDVVHQRKEGSQGERSHEDCHEAVLNN